MRRTVPGLWIGAACAVLFTILPLGFGLQNLWVYFRMRTIPVEVVKSSLRIEAAPEGDSVDYLLRMELKTTDAARRIFSAEAYLGRATYPEEAYDELASWAPGTRHLVYQVRGAARQIRLPGPGQAPELDKALVLLVLSLFPGFFAIALVAILFEENAWLRRTGLRKALGIWMVFSAVGLVMGIGFGLFVWSEAPKRFGWVQAVARETGEIRATAEAEPRAFPANVEVTDHAKRILDGTSYRLLQFTAPDGRTWRAGIGTLGGPYDSLRYACPAGEAECRFSMDPANRWDVATDLQWDGQFFLPAGLFLFFAVTFSGVGWFIRRVEP